MSQGELVLAIFFSSDGNVMSSPTTEFYEDDEAQLDESLEYDVALLLKVEFIK
ncbi:hypothetical protein [Oceanobacillus chungangensis]|uniref:hypothetical protein n=1 Tax=Oceanobacillus chungangensis TaxID=1229152 RepID=UPI0014736E25|nr:hypothetical protein [Oceanobacillus chungangensis]